MTCSTMSTPAPPHCRLLRSGMSIRLSTVAAIRGQPGRSRANEDDARVGVGRAELDADVPPAPVAEAFHRDGVGNRALLACRVHQE